MDQESGKIKQLKLRIPMAAFVQLEQDAAEHNEKPATRARHILCDAVMYQVPDPVRVKELIAKNWEIINNSKRKPKGGKPGRKPGTKPEVSK